MKILRQILAGTVIGGAFGAKTGAYLLPIVDMSSSIIEAGFALGSFSGFVLVLSAALLNRKVKKPKFQWSPQKGIVGSPF